ncbi:uncharacterized protein LOC112468804 [Temnothorax curvispinosus]|uniref:Uncharacterized protein LOC112468804 n=1 Tax=Temnothorax curvispinosus TaxID=300111 RepID=A0A6J1RGM7_9HYME|nr:uncharacterized protein LOC112468804 [Temnothorax curvispinosus]
MSQKILQANLNHCRAAQDLFLQAMAECGGGLGIAAEPYRVPRDHPCWAVDRRGSVAITWRQTAEPVACTRIETGDGFVAVKWDHITGSYQVAVYVSPNISSAQFNEYLGRLWDCVTKILPEPVVVAGDFNAKSALWGSPVTDTRGKIFERWAAGLGLCIVNSGTTQTCVRRWGGSIVDITWTSPYAARRITRWRVADETETMSDHRYVEMDISVTPPEVWARRRELPRRFPRWALRKMDQDKFRASIQTSLWADDVLVQSEDVKRRGGFGAS